MKFPKFQLSNTMDNGTISSVRIDHNEIKSGTNSNTDDS
jgi:hypothetical protein